MNKTDRKRGEIWRLVRAKVQNIKRPFTRNDFPELTPIQARQALSDLAKKREVKVIKKRTTKAPHVYIQIKVRPPELTNKHL